MKRNTISALVLGCVILVVVIGFFSWRCPVTTVFIVRHAEKSDVGGADPPLSAAGEARAEALAHVVDSAGIDVIFATEYVRTQATVAPAAAAAGLTPHVIPAVNTHELADSILSGYRGKEILVAGHSNTVPALLQDLGISHLYTIGDSDYDNLFIVHIVHSIPRRAMVTWLHYGNPSPQVLRCYAREHRGERGPALAAPPGTRASATGIRLAGATPAARLNHNEESNVPGGKAFTRTEPGATVWCCNNGVTDPAQSRPFDGSGTRHNMQEE
jgi:phosphohistidine phosphatase SixA